VNPGFEIPGLPRKAKNVIDILAQASLGLTKDVNDRQDHEEATRKKVRVGAALQRMNEQKKKDRKDNVLSPERLVTGQDSV
jgi:hypothetical protein